MRAAANLVRVFDLSVRSPGSAISRLVYFHKYCDSLHPPPDLLTTARHRAPTTLLALQYPVQPDTVSAGVKHVFSTYNSCESRGSKMDSQ